MTIPTLSHTEAALLTVAAREHGGAIVLPTTMKPVSAKRLIGKLAKHGLIAERPQDGGSAHVLTTAGYAAIGIELPKAQGQTKLALIKDLLARADGATLSELIKATGWLPHTTRAALSRLRSAGESLEKRLRADGTTAYHRATVEPRLRLSLPPGSSTTATAEPAAAVAATAAAAAPSAA